MKEYTYNVTILLRELQKIKHKNHRKDADKLYVDSIVRFFKRHIPFKTGYAYRAHLLCANDNTLKQLEKCLSPLIYFDISPKTDNDCKDNTIVLRYKKQSDIMRKIGEDYNGKNNN